jgi:hypothetical protein
MCVIRDMIERQERRDAMARQREQPARFADLRTDDEPSYVIVWLAVCALMICVPVIAALNWIFL